MNNIEIKYVVIKKILDWRGCLVPEIVYDIGNGDSAISLEALGVDSNKETGHIYVPLFELGDVLICQNGVLLWGEKLTDLEGKMNYELFDDVKKAIKRAIEVRESLFETI